MILDHICWYIRAIIKKANAVRLLGLICLCFHDVKKHLEKKTKIHNSLMLKGVGLLQVHMILTIFTQGTRLTYDQVFLNLFVLLGFFSGKIVSSV